MGTCTITFINNFVGRIMNMKPSKGRLTIRVNDKMYQHMLQLTPQFLGLGLHG